MQYGGAFCGEYPQRGEKIHFGLGGILFRFGNDFISEGGKNEKSPCSADADQGLSSG